MLRLAASSRLLFPYARRIVFRNHHLYTTTSQLFQSQSRLVNDKIVQIMESKINSSRNSIDNNTMPAEAPVDFPFAIQNYHSSTRLTLTRDHQSEDDAEKIEVRVLKPEDEEQEFLTLITEISKPNGTKMKFRVSLCAENISVVSISVVEPKEPIPRSFGPYDLEASDSEWQRPLRDFLESRGIKATYFQFLWELAWGIDQRPPTTADLEWQLEKLKMFFK